VKVRDTIAIAATFTADPLEPCLSFWLDTLGLQADVVFAPYGQVFQSLLDPGSELRRSRSGLNVLLVRFEDWAAESWSAHVDELIEAIRVAATRDAVPYLVCLCPASPAAVADRVLSERARLASAALATACAEFKNVTVVDADALLSLYPVADYHDPEGVELGHIPYTPLLFASLGTLLARRFHALCTARRKVIVVDCDDTLWGGVCGEVGSAGVVIDEGRLALQRFLVAQQAAGTLVCLCSKNNEADVHDVFAWRPEMALRPEHVVAERINWNPKSANIRSLAEELDLGLDSFIFIDDSPLECAEVRSGCPSVVTLPLPQAADEISEFLRHSWVFDRAQKTTSEDRRRTELYRENAAREGVRRRAGSLAEFLAGLDLKVGMEPLSAENRGRIAQLTQRTNQFNVTTIRRSEAELQHLCDAGYECLAVTVSDRFGDYGLVGAIIWRATEDALDVDTFLLSCRVLGRGVEHRLLAELGARAESLGLSHVVVRVIATERNRPALEFLDIVGSPYKTDGVDGYIFRFPTDVAKAAESRVGQTSARSSNDAVDRSELITDRSTESWERVLSVTSRSRDPRWVLQEVAAWRLGQRRSSGTDAPTPSLGDRPMGLVEEQIAQVWRDLLAQPEIGRQASFFELGGNSLLAAQMVSRLRHQFDMRLSLANVFETPTIAALAQCIEASGPSRDMVPPLGRAERALMVPLSFAQYRLWFLDQLEPGTSSYNIAFAVWLRGALDVHALERSLLAIVDRHEILRTRFPLVEGHPVQVVDPPGRPALTVVDLSDVEADRRLVVAEHAARTEAERPFDLADGPLARMTVLKLDAQTHRLLVTLHHIIADGWSIDVFTRELNVLYESFVAGEADPLPPLPVQYGDYAVWQRSFLQGEHLETELAHWKQQLAGLSPLLALPTSRPRPAVRSGRGKRHEFVLNPLLIADAERFTQGTTTTLFMTLLASFKALLFAYSGQQDCAVGSPIAGRGHPDLEPLIGFFANTLLLRTRLSGDLTFRSLVSQIRSVALEAYAHQELPFEKIVEALRPPRDRSRTPLFQVNFRVVLTPVTPVALPGLQASPVTFLDTGASKFDLALELATSEGGTSFLEYSTDLFDKARAGQMLYDFERLSRALLSRPEDMLRDVPAFVEIANRTGAASRKRGIAIRYALGTRESVT